MEETRGVIFFNRGEKCIVRAIVCFYTLRKYWDGPATIFLEKPYPDEFEEVCKYFNIDVIHNEEKHEMNSLVRKTEMFGSPPYDRTLWLDLDTIVCGDITEMFDYLDDADVCIPNFCDWRSNGKIISKRIKQFEGLAKDRHMELALKDFPAINTGVLSFRKSDKWIEFVKYWLNLANRGNLERKIFISDEISGQVLFPSLSEWDLKLSVCDKKFNVSVRYGKDVEDKRILHAHGQKHVGDFALSYMWKDEFNEMCDKNIANINSFLTYADKRLAKWLKEGKPKVQANNLRTDVTIVSACDKYYVDILRETFANWRKYKNIDSFPVIIFVNEIPLDDNRLDFLRLPNVRMIVWDEKCMDKVESHRELMLSSFVFGAADYVQTPYWLKLDSDSFSTDSRPLFSEEMKKFGFCGHKWHYSRPEHIRSLDTWAKSHWQRKLKTAKPMIEDGKIEGNRFYHNTRRTISFIQLHTTKFTKFCVKLLKTRRLPAPTQDTFLFYVLNRFDPHLVGTANFKRDHGFTQGRGKLGVEHIKNCLKLVDEAYIKNEQKKIEENNKVFELSPTNNIFEEQLDSIDIE